MNCPTELTCSAFVDGALGVEESRRVLQHSHSCSACQAQIELLTAERKVLRSALQTATANGAIPAFVPRPTISRQLAWLGWAAITIWAVSTAWVGLLSTLTLPDWLAWLSPRAALPERFAEAAESARRIDVDNVVVFSTEGRHIVGAGRAVSTDGLTGLYDISVDTDARRRGHGRSLLKRLMAWAAERSEDVYLEVGALNSAAIELYAGEGFVERYRYRYRHAD
jgi:ribosomal protein S18 acetylase RimI-like enzyme